MWSTCTSRVFCLYPMCNFTQSRVAGEALVREAGTSGCLTSQTWCKIHIGIFKCSLILVWAHTLHSYTFIITSVVCTSTKNDLKSLSCCRINIYPYPSYTPTGHLSATSKDSHSHSHNLESLVNLTPLTASLWAVRGSRSSHTDGGFKPRTFLAVKQEWWFEVLCGKIKVTIRSFM